jgi:hypothetical protein
LQIKYKKEMQQIKFYQTLQQGNPGEDSMKRLGMQKSSQIHEAYFGQAYQVPPKGLQPQIH